MKPSQKSSDDEDAVIQSLHDFNHEDKFDDKIDENLAKVATKEKI